MSHYIFPKMVEMALGGDVTLDSSDVKVALLKLDGSVADTMAVAVTGATNATPIVLTATNNWTAGDLVMVFGVGGTTSANGLRRIKARDGTTVTLQNPIGTDTAGNGDFASNGLIINLTQAQYLAQLDGLITGSAVTLASKTLTGGELDATDPAFTSVAAGLVSGFLVYMDTGNAATSPVLFISDGRLNIEVAADAAQNATTVWVRQLEGPIPDDTTIVLSNGVTMQLNGAAVAGAMSLTTDALSAAVAAGSNGNAAWTGALFPTTFGATVNLNLALAAGTEYVGAVKGFFRA